MLNIVTVPNPILTQKTARIEKVTPQIIKLAEEMVETCRAADGIGLAAPQINKSIRMCIINLDHVGLPPFALVNPKITKKSWKKVEMEEGCLSIPGVFGMVKRPEKIQVTAVNLENKKITFKADGLLARVIQHEVDHLDGILFTSKMVKETSDKKIIGKM